ncbi:MAG: peptide deformylase [Pseudomonadota bacterium]|nr:peptide deformylase [Pseudomonadota bacterium]
MAILNILKYPDFRLHTVAKAVAQVDDGARKLIADMAETMYAAPGIGLAATQVDVHRQIIVIDVSDERNELNVFINPRLTRAEGVADREEGCLSLPGIFDTVSRAAKITVEALDREGKPFTLDADDLLAVCIQHEMDHLQGKVFVEYLSSLKQTRIRHKLRKAQRKAA